MVEGGNGHYYEFVATGSFSQPTWEQARAAAAARSHTGLPGGLATITSAAEQQFVFAARPAAPAFFYLGGVQAPGAAAPDAGWSWITGEPWDFTAWSINPREPNDISPAGEPSTIDRGYEQHLSFGTFFSDAAANWNDLNGTQPRFVGGYVVEYVAVPEPASAMLLAAAGVMLCRPRRGGDGAKRPQT